MMDFVRFDKSDYERLALRDRLTINDAVNLFVNAKKDLDKSFDCQYWRKAARIDYWSLLEKIEGWHIGGKLIFYGPAGDFGRPLINPHDYFNLVDNEACLKVNEVFVMKCQMLIVFSEVDEKVIKRIKGLMEGKFWKEPRADVSEKDLVQIIAKKLIEAEDKLPSIDAIIKDINLCGIGNEYSKSTLYEWIGEVYPA